MNYHDATQHAIADIAAGDEPDSDPVRAALQLAVYAWQTCHPQPATATRWAMFGNRLSAAIDELGQPAHPFVVVGDLPVPDTIGVRHQTATLTAAIAAHLDAAAGDPRHGPEQRWAWAAAAARLRSAGSALTGRP
jgi:hypothetical protein